MAVARMCLLDSRIVSCLGLCLNGAEPDLGDSMHLKLLPSPYRAYYYTEGSFQKAAWSCAVQQALSGTAMTGMLCIMNTCRGAPA